VTNLAEKPFFDPNAPTRRQALVQLGADELEVEGALVDG
jgi:hypothetical protein